MHMLTAPPLLTPTGLPFMALLTALSCCFGLRGEQAFMAQLLPASTHVLSQCRKGSSPAECCWLAPMPVCWLTEWQCKGTPGRLSACLGDGALMCYTEVLSSLHELCRKVAGIHMEFPWQACIPRP